VGRRGRATKEKAGCWTRRRTSAQVRHGSNIQLLSYSLVTARDATALGWLADQYAIRADALGLLLGRLSPEAPRTVHAWQYSSGQRAELPTLADATVRYHLRRWLQARWVSVQRALGHTWIVPTQRGLAVAGVDWRPWTLVPSRLAHVHAVGLVRLAIEAANPQAEWVSERELARLRAHQRASWWLPDGGLVVADAVVNGACPPVHTIEVELTPKHLARLQQVFEARYPGEVQTTYFTPPAHQDGLRRRLGVLEQATRARNEPWSRVTVVPLPKLPGVRYEGAA
jgi:hypothetical protein